MSFNQRRSFLSLSIVSIPLLVPNAKRREDPGGAAVDVNTSGSGPLCGPGPYDILGREAGRGKYSTLDVR